MKVFDNTLLAHGGRSKRGVLGSRVCGTFSCCYLVSSYMILDSGKFWARVCDLRVVDN